MTQGLRPRATKKAQPLNCNAEQDPGQATKGRLVKNRNKLWDAAISDQLLSISRENKDYLEAIFDGEAEGLAVVRDGKLVHYGFLMYRNRTARLLGFMCLIEEVDQSAIVPSRFCRKR